MDMHVHLCVSLYNLPSVFYTAVLCVQHDVSGMRVGSCARVCPGVEAGQWVGLTSSAIGERKSARVHCPFVWNTTESGVVVSLCARVCLGLEVGSWVGMTASTVADHETARARLSSVYKTIGSAAEVESCAGGLRWGHGWGGHRPQLLNKKLPVRSSPLCATRWGQGCGCGHVRGCAKRWR